MPRRNDELIEALRAEIQPLKTELAVVRQQVQSLMDAMKNMYPREALEQRFKSIEDELAKRANQRDSTWMKIAAVFSILWIILQALPNIVHAFSH